MILRDKQYFIQPCDVPSQVRDLWSCHFLVDLCDVAVLDDVIGR